MSNLPIYCVLQKLKQFDSCSKNKNKCTPKYTLKLVSDQLKLGKPIYKAKNATQHFDIKKMEIFQFDVYFEFAQYLKGENTPYGKYKTAQHLSALNLLKKIFNESNESKTGNKILDLINKNQNVWYEIAPSSKDSNKNLIKPQNSIKNKTKSIQPLMSVKL